jgi:hypothetical protein
MDGDRTNVVKYISPAFAGFTVSSSWGEDDRMGTALRYAGEFNGVRLAAGIGYEKITDFNPTADGGAGCANPGGAPASGVPGALIAQATVSNTSCEVLGMSASAMHVPTGIFLTGAYSESKDKNLGGLRGRTLGVANQGYDLFNQRTDNVYNGPINDKNTQFLLMGGIEQKWFSLGKSTLYGEYIKSDTGNALAGGAGGTGQLRAVGADPILSAGGCRNAQPSTVDLAGNVVAGAAASCSIASSQVKTWGIGFNQEITAAAADAYISFRNTSGSLNIVDNATGAARANTGTKDIQVLMTGMIIRF